MSALLFYLHSNPASAQASDFSPGIRVGQITEKGLAELSGIAASRRNPGVLWVHNDRNRDTVYAVSTNGQLLASWTLDKPVDDFEDIAIGPGPAPELQYLYCGDMGDNPATRSNIRVYRAAEPAVYSYQGLSPVSQKFPSVEKFTLAYPDGSHNAEALMVDPLTGDVFIATKEPGRCRLYRAAAAQLQDGAELILEFVTEVPFDIVSAADITADGSEILLRQEDFAKAWRRAPGQTVAQALEGVAVPVPVIGTPTEPNGEGVGFAAGDSGYFTVSEGVDPLIYYFARTNELAAATEPMLSPLAALWKYLDDGTNLGTSWREPQFDDAAWPSGAAQFGYGEKDEQTVIGFGGDKDQKNTTTYFRRQLDISNGAEFAALKLRVVYDDGIAVYLNGREVIRRELAPEAASSDAALSAGGARENVWQEFVTANPLHSGTNIIAAEVHRRSASEADLSFDLQLLGVARSESIQFIGLQRGQSAENWSVEFRGARPGAIRLEGSTNLQDWSDLGTVSSVDGSGTVPIVNDSAWRFYRLRQ